MNESVQKILIVGPAWVGDMVMAQTLFKLLKQNYPQATLDVLAPEWSRALTTRMPEIHQTFTMPLAHGVLNLRERYRIAKVLRAEQYDLAIVLPNSFKSALVPYWAKIAKRRGFRGEMRYGLLNDLRILQEKKLPLMIQRFAALAFESQQDIPNALPYPSLVVQVTTQQHALQKFNLTTQSKIIALCPGAEYGPAKRWPAEYFAEVARHKMQAGWQVWIFGSAKDQAIARDIMELTGQACCDLTGKTNLAEAIDLMALVDLVISNDSGLMHIACALARPVVALYGSSSPRFTPPLSEQVQIVSLNLSCSPCFQRNCPLNHTHCLTQLFPQQVEQAITALG